jgi:thymidine kinase
MNQNPSGYLEIILGPMFSGKTSRLLDIYKQCTFCNLPVLVINHVSDTRYDNSLLSTHDKVMIPCIQSKGIMEVVTKEENKQAEVVLINEGQFFPDLYDSVAWLLQEKKKIYVCGLDGDFKRQKFGQMLDLIPLCDKVTKLVSLCSRCRNGTSAIFSMRLTDEKEQTVVGSDSYIPVCRMCYVA